MLEPAARNQPDAWEGDAGSNPCWMSRAIFSSSSMRIFRAFFFEQARVFKNGRGFDRERLQQLAIAGGKIGGRGAGIHVQEADGGFCGRGVMRVSSDDPLRI